VVIVDQSRGRAPEPLEVQDVVYGDEHTLVLVGELDVATAVEPEGVIMSCIEGATRLTLDLSQLAFLDSTGVRLILFTQELCRRHGAEFGLVRGPRQVQRVFEIAGLLERLPFQTDPRA
jgi:anti-anti-sigma factor